MVLKSRGRINLDSRSMIGYRDSEVELILILGSLLHTFMRILNDRKPNFKYFLFLHTHFLRLDLDKCVGEILINCNKCYLGWIIFQDDINPWKTQFRSCWGNKDVSKAFSCLMKSVPMKTVWQNKPFKKKHVWKIKPLKKNMYERLNL